jgi:hypothetical protein
VVSFPVAGAPHKPPPPDLPSCRLPYKPAAGPWYRNLGFGRWAAYFEYPPARDPTDSVVVSGLNRSFSLEENNCGWDEADEKLPAFVWILVCSRVEVRYSQPTRLYLLFISLLISP